MKKLVSTVLAVFMLFGSLPLYASEAGPARVSGTPVTQAHSLSGSELNALASLERKSQQAATVKAGEMSDEAIIAVTVISVAVLVYAISE
ncbi:hypothetical protein BOW53_05285 [Solemya pervernicosa gill symbiont]|uniref:Uncharacterized protein n=2 Tax=Gammaproteobacteria incertae sedis TaxID=118884 RepID=A0A1T2L7C8_9GAMM|nr:hypothetical protein [Candidatus Reidiella endopervernicosa]OOZ40944.1 hypothetical protein BOW53_05285 [Solemya pervernicosa gill symbiont]QKQ24991.1 hypothetical protein HUE57_00840 [Candidatus Reidiella endopervernicosa]